MFNITNAMKATFLGYTFRTGVDTRPTPPDTLLISKLSHVSGYAPARFGLERIGISPKGPTQAS